MALVGRYGVEKAVGGGIARVGALADQMDGDTDDGAADHGQIQNAGGMAHAAAVLAGADIRAQVQAGFAAPVSLRSTATPARAISPASRARTWIGKTTPSVSRARKPACPCLSIWATRR